MKTRMILVNYFILACAAFASIPQAEGSQNLFRVVILPDSVKHKLAIFLQQKEKMSSAARSVLVYNYANPKDVQFKDGMYTFMLPGPHFQPRVFIFENGQLQMFEHIDIDGLLEEYLAYIKTSGIPERHKIKYLRLIWRFLDEGFKRESR